MSDPTQTARDLTAAASRAAKLGRKLIDLSLDLSRQALAALPAGTVLRFDVSSSSDPYRITLGDDGVWTHPDDGPVDAKWVEDYWLRRSLILDDDSVTPSKPWR